MQVRKINCVETWRAVAALVGGLMVGLPTSLVIADAVGDAGNLGYPLAGFVAGTGLGLLRMAGLRRG
jgi:hypothetical protein